MADIIRDSDILYDVQQDVEGLIQQVEWHDANYYQLLKRMVFDKINTL